MQISQEIWRRVEQDSLRRKHNGQIVDDHAFGYGTAFLFILIMSGCLFGMIHVFTLIVDVSDQYVMKRLGMTSDILFLEGVYGWFGIPVGLSSLAIAYGLTAVIVLATPFAKRAAAQTIYLGEKGRGNYLGLTGALSDWIVNGVDEQDPDAFLIAYWRRSAVLSAKTVLFLLLIASCAYAVETRSFKVVTSDGIILQKSLPGQGVKLEFQNIERIEAGCRQYESGDVVRTRFRYVLFFENGERFDLYAAKTPGSRLAALERVDAAAVVAGAPIVHANKVENGLSVSAADVEAACVARVIDRYKRSNEVRAFKLLRLSDSRA